MELVIALNRKLRTAFACLLVLATVGMLEGATRFFWTQVTGVPFWHPSRLLYLFYPELAPLNEQGPASPGQYDVLLLGASTLEFSSAVIERELGKDLARPVRVSNLGRRAHTSRDSAIKYRHLTHPQFDLVVHYDGLNEVRANNIAREGYRDDYSHYSWYDEVNRIDRDFAWMDFFSLPFTAEHFWAKLSDHLTGRRFVPTGNPVDEWVRYGGDIKTVPAFASNLSAIVALAHRRGEKLLLSTVATYFAPGYSDDKFLARSLDYSYALEESFPARIWGTPENIQKGIEAHNEVIRSVARADPTILFLDTERLLPKSGAYFSDICHFSARGKRKFESLLAEKIRER